MTSAGILPPAGLSVTIGGLTRAELRAELRSRGVLLNAHAGTLLDGQAFERAAAPRAVTVVERTVADLGLPQGASLSRILESADGRALLLCPPATGPYLRLALTEQASAGDSVMSGGRAPSGSLTVAAPPAGDADEHPKGFYLRVVDGQAWLRGYTCDDEHVWSPEDRFAFQLAPRPTARPTAR